MKVRPGTTQYDWERDEEPESSKPIAPQQWTRGEFGQSLGDEEEGHCTPVFRAELLDHLQQHMAFKENAKVRD